MPLNSIQSGAQLCQVKISDNKPVVTETKSQLTQKFKAASNCINAISLRHDSSANIVNKSDVMPVTGHLMELLSEKYQKCSDEISQKTNALNKIKISLEKNESFARKLSSVTATNVRLKGEEFKPCYQGLTHLRKSIFSTSYKDSLQNTKKIFKALDKKQISTLLEKNIRTGNDKSDKLGKKIDDKKNELINIRADLNRFKDNASILTKVTDEMFKREINELVKTTGTGNFKGRVLNNNERAAFFSLYSTSYGSREINSAFSFNRELAIDTDKVTREIKRRWGYKTFASGAVRERDAINLIGKIKLEELKQALENMYNEAINSKAAKEPKTLYRGQNVDNETIEKIKKAYKENKLFNPGYLMSTSESSTEAAGFTKGDANKLFMTVKGVSGISVYSPHIVKEEHEYAFAPQSKFEIEKLSFKDNHCDITLVEKRPDEYKGKASVTFPRY